MPQASSKIERVSHRIDATDVPVGRLASRIATLLIGKQKTTYAPNKDEGDIVYVTNVAKIRLTGKKEEQKKYRRYTGHQGGLRERSVKESLQKDPASVLQHAVKNMLPNTTHRAARLHRLHITA